MRFLGKNFKNVKFFYYLKNYLLLIIPNFFFRKNFNKRLSNFSKNEIGNLIERVNYYNKIDSEVKIDSTWSKLSDLKNIRGFDYAQYQKEKGQHLLKIVEKGLKADPVPSLKSRKKSLPPEMRPAVTLLSAWLAQFATDQNIDPALLGSRSDIEELLRGESDSRLQVGWRHEEVGEQVDNLLKGKSSLSFENGRLVIESRGTLA